MNTRMNTRAWQLKVLFGTVLVLAIGVPVLFAGPGETGSGIIPPGFSKVTFIHHVGRPPQVIVEHGSNGKAPPFSQEANICSNPATDGTDQCDSFSWDGQFWPSAAVTYHVNLQNSGDDGTFEAAIRASAQTWEDDPGSAFNFSFGGLTGRKASSLRNRMDGNNDVTFDDLKKYQDPIAVTIFWYFTSSGEVVEADLINNRNFPWATDGNPLAFDMQDIETHEFGHYLVLGDLYDPSDSALTMFGFGSLGETDKRTLGQGDRLGIRAIYGAGCTTDSDCGAGLCCSGSCETAFCSQDADCDDGDACTIDSCSSPDTCGASCSHTDVTQCSGGDGCCPDGCDSNTDSDCSASACGDGVCAGNGEDCFSCRADCRCSGRECSRACCGDGICFSENVHNCPADCS